ncbi:MAG TPA: tRNA (adenosine(37)-N6)-threonylcarbamoyltransferase complex ATPase subunit type 1 TsaE [Geobacteraceae bacterium]|nr:tRNA (adenosine(37)-N6)-threonylcarbamoyltransferase complex ATPase subunit type 1 TsaE [Geobacteraceae bacterium]
MLTIITRSVDATVALGESLGKLLSAGDFIALTGELGSGKTHFVRGVAGGLDVDPAVRVTSPTFTLMNPYSGRLPLYHFDLYRLAGGQDVADLGFEEYFYGTGVCIVEWAERLGDLLPVERLSVTFDYLDEDVRSIVLEPCGARYRELLAHLHAP